MRRKKHLEGALWLSALGSLLLATQTSVKTCLMLLGLVSVAATATVVPLHFWRAWRRVASVPNRGEYMVWVGIETFFSVGLFAGCAFVVGAR